jgi:hypothetical protein
MHRTRSTRAGRVQTYDGAMASFVEQLAEHVRAFFTNWRNPDYGFAEKVVLTFRNRAVSLARGGCCGNHGQPGC